MAQLVDPFVPVSRPKQPQGQRLTFVHPREATRSSPSTPPPVQAQRLVSTPPRSSRPSPAVRPLKPTKPRLSKKLSRTGLQALAIAAMVPAAFLVQSIVFGQIMIAVYAIFALIFRINSRTSFTMALMSLGIVMLSTLRSDAAQANTFAVYAFLLLVIGTLSMAREAPGKL